MGMKLYEIDNNYVDYLIPYAPHLFHNKQPGQQHERKYVGIVLEINGLKYFAALSSFKPKHHRMKESVDFIKLGDYSVINLNLILPVPDGLYSYVDISKEKDARYKSLLLAEYRIIKSKQDRIRKNALTVYNHKIAHADATALARRCNDFKKLEEVSKKYK